jgi:hypothetical protein
VTVARLLGARYGVQGAMLLVVPRPPVRVVRAVDVLHALSMLAFLGSPRYRRPALASAAFSVGLTLLARRATVGDRLGPHRHAVRKGEPWGSDVVTRTLTA